MFDRDHFTTLPTNFVLAGKTDMDRQRHETELNSLAREMAASPVHTRLVRVLQPFNNYRVGQLVDVNARIVADLERRALVERVPE